MKFGAAPKQQVGFVELAREQTLSAEERELQFKQIAQLDYIVFLLEELCHRVAPGRLDEAEYRKNLKDRYHASR